MSARKVVSRTVSLEDGKYEFDIDDYGLMTAARRNGADWPAGFELRHTKVFFAALNEIREEREATVRYLRRVESDDSWMAQPPFLGSSAGSIANEAGR